MVEPREAEAKGQKFLHTALLLGNHCLVILMCIGMLHTCCAHNKFINLHSFQALRPSLCEVQDNMSAMWFM